jgi:hypothetical protein
VVLLDAHFGYGGTVLTSMDPAVRDESSPNVIDPALDVFNPANGYDIAGSRYSDAFNRRYFRAQAERTLRRTDMALARMQAITQGRGLFPDDEPFPLARNQARMWQLDTSLISHTKAPTPSSGRTARWWTWRAASASRAPPPARVACPA